MDQSLLKQPIAKSLILFSLPMIFGNFLQQLYNIVDTLIVGKVLGPESLVAVGSSYTLMVLLTSMILGLCMGSGIVFARYFGANKMDDLKRSIFNAFFLIFIISFVMIIVTYLLLPHIIQWLQIPYPSIQLTHDYMRIILIGMIFTTVYNFLASILRSVGNTKVPLVFLFICTLLNIILDLVFMIYLSMGVSGAALATIIAQGISGLLLLLYYIFYLKQLHVEKKYWTFQKEMIYNIISMSSLTAIQQSIMNFGILMIQGLVNSFGGDVSAAFAIAVKIDAFAYMPAQDFGNAFSTFVAQNHGAHQIKRIKDGLKISVLISSLFCLGVSLVIFIFAKELMCLFIDQSYVSIINIGIGYLRIEGVFYVGIGILFILYGFYRGLSKPSFSIALTIASLGSRVLLAYILSTFSVIGIWVSIPLGWALADALGLIYYFMHKSTLLTIKEEV